MHFKRPNYQYASYLSCIWINKTNPEKKNIFYSDILLPEYDSNKTFAY